MRWFEKLPEVGVWAKDIAEHMNKQEKELEREVRRLQATIDYRVGNLNKLAAMAAYRAAKNYTADEIEEAAKKAGGFSMSDLIVGTG